MLIKVQAADSPKGKILLLTSKNRILIISSCEHLSVSPEEDLTSAGETQEHRRA